MTALLDNATTWDGQSSFPQFGESGTRSVGQTFLAPDQGNTDLRRIRFWLNDDNILGSPVMFKLRVLAWDDTTAQPAGPTLFESAMLSTGQASGFEGFAVETGRLVLDPNRSYVAVLESQNDGVNDAAEIGRNDGYGDGQIVVQPADNAGPLPDPPSAGGAFFKGKSGAQRRGGGGGPPPGGVHHPLGVDGSSLFVQPLRWMFEGLASDGDPAAPLPISGKLSCPGCGARLGSFNWSGGQSAGGAWVVPAFQLHLARLDAMGGGGVGVGGLVDCGTARGVLTGVVGCGGCCGHGYVRSP